MLMLLTLFLDVALEMNRTSVISYIENLISQKLTPYGANKDGTCIY